MRPGGQNIDIRTVGVTIMRKIPGMEAAVRAKRPPLDGMAMIDKDGRPLATMTATGDPDQQSLVSEFEIFRGDLAQVLYDLTKDNEHIRYIFGEQVAAMKQKGGDDGLITVDFANGSPTTDFDLVVACDGATSRTRALGFGCGVRDHIEPLNSWAAYFPLKESLHNEGNNIGHGYSGTGGRFVAFCSDLSGADRATFMSLYPSDARNATQPFLEAAKQGDDALKQYVARQFGDAGWKSDVMVKGMMDAKDFYASEIVSVKVPSLHKGRFALVGDAGYASGFTGSGTSLAIAGAYVLAGEVGRHPGDLAAGLRAYEERMKPLIKDLQKIPPGVRTFMAPQTAWGIRLRNMIFVFIVWCMALSKKFAWVGRITGWFGQAIATSFGTDKFGLPEYEWVA